jgi:hypothetical protein
LLDCIPVTGTWRAEDSAAVLPWSAAAKVTPGVVKFEENTLPVVVLGALDIHFRP